MPEEMHVVATSIGACPRLAVAFAAYLAQAHGRRDVRLCAPDISPVALAVDADPGLPWRIAGAASLDWHADGVARTAVNLCWLNQDNTTRLEGALAETARLSLAQDSSLVLAVDAQATGVDDPAALTELLARHDLQPSLVGYGGVVEHGASRRTTIALLDGSNAECGAVPANFKVLAIVPAFNEADIVGHTLEYLVRQGLDVYLLDNWSTDRTVDIAREWLGRGLLAIEHFPGTGPSASYNLRGLLARVEEIALEVPAHWYVLHDVDERRQSPWPELDLRQAIWRVDQRGFTCIDHLTLNFWPTTPEPLDERFDVDAQLPFFEFSVHPGHFHQRRAWKNSRQRVDLANSAGHDVDFPERRVEPLKFLQKHFPIRSQAHGERKVLRERLPRFRPDERAVGWHAQYDGQARADQCFVRSTADLLRFDPSAFHADYFVQRLSGLGVFQEPPHWASPMLRPE